MTKYEKKPYKVGINRSHPRGAKRSRGVSHTSCSKKRTILKTRIRELEARILAHAAARATYEAKVNELIVRLIENDVLQ